jgi:hypothetical protein
MNEFERILASLPVAQTDEGAKARARARLMDAVATEPETATTVSPRTRSRSRWPALLVGVAAAAITIFILLALLPVVSTGPGGASAASELRRLAPLAARIPAIGPGDGYVYTKVDQRGIDEFSEVGSDTSYDVRVRDQIETWTAADGSGRRVTTYQDVSFPSPADRAAWVSAGHPDLPKVGGSVVDSYEPGGLPVYDVDALPTEPKALNKAIHAGDVIKVPPGDIGTFTAIGHLLAYPRTPPDLRRALFELAARIPEIQFEPSVIDPLGRTGEGFTYPVGTAKQTLIVDPDTAELLARVTVNDQGQTSWEAPLQQAAVSGQHHRS